MEIARTINREGKEKKGNVSIAQSCNVYNLFSSSEKMTKF